jgi:hypothetical protein
LQEEARARAEAQAKAAAEQKRKQEEARAAAAEAARKKQVDVYCVWHQPTHASCTCSYVARKVASRSQVFQGWESGKLLQDRVNVRELLTLTRHSL